MRRVTNNWQLPTSSALRKIVGHCRLLHSLLEKLYRPFDFQREMLVTVLGPPFMGLHKAPSGRAQGASWLAAGMLDTGAAASLP